MERVNSSKEEKPESPFGEVISHYSQQDAIDDGILVYVGNWGRERVLITSALFAQGYHDQSKRIGLIERGLGMLAKSDPEDSPAMCLRVIEKNKIWVIWNPGHGVTFMMPEDY